MGGSLEKFARIDEIDLKILTLLMEDCRLSYNKIAERLGISVATVSARIRKLENLKIIDKYTIKINCKHLGFEGGAFILLKVRGSVEDIVNSLSEFPEIRGIYRITGSFDLLICVTCIDINSLTQLLNNISKLPNLIDSEKIVILEIYKEDPYPDPEILRKAMLKALRMRKR